MYVCVGADLGDEETPSRSAGWAVCLHRWAADFRLDGGYFTSTEPFMFGCSPQLYS